MIGRLTGTVKNGLVEVGGVGFQVTCAEELREGGLVDLHIHTHWNDSGPTLYGFRRPEQVTLFRALIRVSGVGPGSAMALLAGLGVEATARAIATKDQAALSAVRGVGRAGAQRIIASCRLPEGMGADSGTAGRVAAALRQLGWEAGAASVAAEQACRQHQDEGEALRAALRARGAES